MASASISVRKTKVTTRTRSKVRNDGNGKGSKRCPVCGKYMKGGRKKWTKKKADAKCKLKQIINVNDFNELLDIAMISDEERKILWMIYKEKKSLSYIADNLGMSESSIKKKHSKLLMKIGKLF